MRPALFCLLLSACAGPSQQQLRQTPTATSPRTPTLAPPASSSDADRYQVNQGFEDQRDARDASRQAEEARRKQPPEPVPGMPDAQAAPAPSPAPSPPHD